MWKVLLVLFSGFLAKILEIWSLQVQPNPPKTSDYSAKKSM